MRDEQLFSYVKKDDDTEAFERLFHRYYKPLMRFVWSYVKSEAIAEEVVQELFTRLWEKRADLVIRSSLKSYLYSSARNLSIDFLKHREVKRSWEKAQQARYKEEALEKPGIDDDLHNKMLLEEVEEAIKSLPDRRRTIFVLSRYEDMTYQEIADFLDISVNTVETQVSRALSTLRKQFSSLLNFAIGISFFINKF